MVENRKIECPFCKLKFRKKDSELIESNKIFEIRKKS